ncbi:MAG: aldo/keto reductase [Candidatus Nanopelagicales bacterium]
MTELVLGTAQWGAGYGVTNARGKLEDPDIAGIVDVALSAGIRAADTAVGYGDAQLRLRPWSDRFVVTTKISGADPPRIRDHLAHALADLGLERVEACLLHDWDALHPDTAVEAARALEQARTLGQCTRVGVSVYDEEGLASARAAFARLDAVQVPANALDRRLDASPTLLGLAAAGALIQVRSVLLQGLLAGPSEGPLGRHPQVARFHAVAREEDVSPVALALAHVRALPWGHQVVIGVTSAHELRQVLAAMQETAARLAPADLASEDGDLVDPRRWGDARTL